MKKRKWQIAGCLLWLIFLSTSLEAEEKIPYFDKVVLAVTAKDGKESASSGFLVTKGEDLYLVMTRHAAARPDQEISITRAGGPISLRKTAGDWEVHPAADVAVLKNPFEGAPDKDFLSYAISFNELSSTVPPRTSRILMSGYPSGRVLRPNVMPTVKPAMVSTVETKVKYRSKPDDAPRPLFYVSEPMGPGSSGSPVFLIPEDGDLSSALVVGVVSGGNNSESRSATVVTPAKYVIELIEKLE